MAAQWHRFTFVPPGGGRSRFAPLEPPLPGPWGEVWLMLCVGWVFAALACLFLAMRAVMRLGGAVATGGPYAVAHPAPDWIWLVPVSIVSGCVAAVAGTFLAARRSQPNLLPLAWPALFVSLGWNFLEFGLRPPPGAGIAWGWVVCGLFFVPMGVLPLLAALPAVRGRLLPIWRNQGRELPGSAGRLSWRPIVRQLLAALLGAVGGSLLFRALAGG